MQLELADIRRRVARLRRLEQGLAWEIGLQRDDDGLLLFRERKQYVRREAR